MLALASPASLKGVLSPQEAARCSPPACGASPGVEVDEAPVADGGEGTAGVIHTALGGDWRTAVVSDPLGRPVTARGSLLDDGTAVVESAPGDRAAAPRARASATRCARRAAGSASCCSPCWRDQPSGVARRASAARRPSTAEPAMRDVVGGRLRDVPLRVLCDVRNPLLGERGAARVFGPQKGADAAAVEELEARLAGWRSSCRIGTCRARARAAGSARRSRRSAADSSKAQSSCSTRSASTSARGRRPRRHRRGGRRCRRRSRARRRAPSSAAASCWASAASCSAASSGDGIACACVVRPPGARRRRPAPLGEQLAGALVDSG